MNKDIFSVREIQKTDIELITQYWLTADPEFLTGIGADLKKMPSKEEWINMLTEQISQPYTEKKSYCTIWLVDSKPFGHCNVNKIKFGEEAYIHLHVWDLEFRKRGLGTKLVKMSLPYFFKNLQLKTIYSEPYALNPAPNKTFDKAGFTFVKEYITFPGFLNFEQPVNLWELTVEQFKKTINKKG